MTDPLRGLLARLAGRGDLHALQVHALRQLQAVAATVVGMHMSEEYKKQADKYHVNVIIAGHISSDSIGMNLMLDELEKKGIDIVPCSGLIRVSRNKKKAKKKKRKK